MSARLNSILLFTCLLLNFCLGKLKGKFLSTNVPEIQCYGLRVSLCPWHFSVAISEEVISNKNLLSATCSPSPWSCQSGDSVCRSHCPYRGPCDGGFQWCRSPAPGFHPFHFLGHHLLPWYQRTTFSGQKLRKNSKSEDSKFRKNP